MARLLCQDDSVVRYKSNPASSAFQLEYDEQTALTGKPASLKENEELYSSLGRVPLCWSKVVASMSAGDARFDVVNPVATYAPMNLIQHGSGQRTCTGVVQVRSSSQFTLFDRQHAKPRVPKWELLTLLPSHATT